MSSLGITRLPTLLIEWPVPSFSQANSRNNERATPPRFGAVIEARSSRCEKKNRALRPINERAVSVGFAVAGKPTQSMLAPDCCTILAQRAMSAL